MSQENKSPNGHFFDRLDNRMKISGLNGADLAVKAGVTPTAISRYRQGRIPAAEELLRLAQALGVSMEWLLAGIGPTPPHAESGGHLKQAKAEAEKLARQLGEAEDTAKRLRAFLG